MAHVLVLSKARLFHVGQLKTTQIKNEYLIDKSNGDFSNCTVFFSFEM
jgi:hypothetical protein